MEAGPAPYRSQPVPAGRAAAPGREAAAGQPGELVAPLWKRILERHVRAVLRERYGQSRRGEEAEGEEKDRAGAGGERRAAAEAVGPGGTALRGRLLLLLLLLEDAQGTDPIFLCCPWAQGQPLTGDRV